VSYFHTPIVHYAHRANWPDKAQTENGTHIGILPLSNIGTDHVGDREPAKQTRSISKTTKFKCEEVKMRYTVITPKLIPRPYARKLFFVLLVLVGIVSGLLSAATANAADTTSLDVRSVNCLN
jgi:hypothetical protein